MSTGNDDRATIRIRVMSITDSGIIPAVTPAPGAGAGAFRGGDGEPFGQAMEACRQYLLLVANDEIGADLRTKTGASDVVQETFLQAQIVRDSFRGRTSAELLAWLRQILLNKVFNLGRHYRHTAKRRLGLEVRIDAPSGATCLKAGAPSPSEQAVRREQELALAQALDRLPDHYRQAVVWRHHEGLSFEEIADRLGGSAEAARKVWARGVERLQREVEGGPSAGPPGDARHAGR